MSRHSEPPTRSQQNGSGFVSEIFCSVQGEGLSVGERQVFLRTAGCHATCYWCDTVSSKRERTVCLVHGATKRLLQNPMSPELVVESTLALIDESQPVRTVSITGGEPLEQPYFVAAIAAALRQRRLRIHLETSGIESDALDVVLPHVDIVAMDVKLPSATGVDHWDAHEKFLMKLAGKSAFVKVIVDSKTPTSEIEKAVRMIAAIDDEMPLILQPESTTLMNRGEREARQELLDRLDQGQRFGLDHLRDVRVIPQCHRILKLR